MIVYMKCHDCIYKVYSKPFLQIYVMQAIYTLLQKKCTLISSSSPGDPGTLTPTPGHVKSVKWSLEKHAKDPV